MPGIPQVTLNNEIYVKALLQPSDPPTAKDVAAARLLNRHLVHHYMRGEVEPEDVARGAAYEARVLASVTGGSPIESFGEAFRIALRRDLNDTITDVLNVVLPRVLEPQLQTIRDGLAKLDSKFDKLESKLDQLESKMEQ